MTVMASLPVQSVADVIALAKARPGELTFASAGSGGAPHLTGELFKTLTAIDLLHVPYPYQPEETSPGAETGGEPDAVLE
jgi:tripartite-type tricarboxylate transporter receptor subunit TctC